MNDALFRNSIGSSFGFNRLNIDEPINDYNEGNNYHKLTSKYSTMTVKTTMPQYYNEFNLHYNNTGVKSNSKAHSIINAFNLNEDNIVNEQKNITYFNDNNYIEKNDNYKITNFAYSERKPKYEAKAIIPSLDNFDIFANNDGQKYIDPISQNLYNSFFNNYDYNQTDNYDIGIINNNGFMNDIQNNNNFEILNENNNNYPTNSNEINNAFLSTDIQEQKTDGISNTEEILSDNDLKEYFIKCSGGIVKDYAYYEDHGERNYMEDQGKVVENLNGDPNQILFCLYDGHGGDKIAKFLQNNFQLRMKKMLPFIDYENDFLELFKQLDEEIKSLKIPNSGSTASIAYIENNYGKRNLHCASIGDSRIILVKKNKVIRLSYDDRVDDPNEHNRIISQGGVIKDGRVNGALMLSRCFGDWDIKKYGVIVDPHVVNLELNDDDLYLILATDGVWDYLSDEQCKDVIKSNKNTLDICKNIVVEALRKGSDDNISCIVVAL